jgi:hypothetical protein
MKNLKKSLEVLKTSVLNKLKDGICLIRKIIRDEKRTIKTVGNKRR